MIGRGKIFYRFLLLVMLAFAIHIQALPALAVKVLNVSATKHNLSTSATVANFYSTDETEICIFCHTPHNANVSVPLWNQYSTTMAFATYTSDTLTGGAVHTGTLPAESTSRLCLSCHEGTIAMNALVNFGATNARPTMESGYDSIDDIGGPPGVGAYLSDDLTSMHPIGFDYELARAGDSEIYPIATPEGNGLRFFGSNGFFLECATCHDPHVDGEATGDLAYSKFLRIPNSSSSLCLSCHNK